MDVVFADVAQPDQARIVGLNAQYFLKNGGNFVISIKASCIDSTAPPEAVFAREVKKLQEMQLKPKEQVRHRILAWFLCITSPSWTGVLMRDKFAGGAHPISPLAAPFFDV